MKKFILVLGLCTLMLPPCFSATTVQGNSRTKIITVDSFSTTASYTHTTSPARVFHVHSVTFTFAAEVTTATVTTTITRGGVVTEISSMTGTATTFLDLFDGRKHLLTGDVVTFTSSDAEAGTVTLELGDK